MPGDRGGGGRAGGNRSSKPTAMGAHRGRCAMIDAMPRVSSPVFIGRAAELDRLCAALDRARARQPSFVLVAGEAGIGKTRLVTEFSTRARESGARVLVGGSLQVGATGLPYAPIVGALRPLLRSLPPERLDELLGAGRVELAHLVPDLAPPEARCRARRCADLGRIPGPPLRGCARAPPSSRGRTTARPRPRGHPLGRCGEPRPRPLPRAKRARRPPARRRDLSVRRAAPATRPPPAARRAPAPRSGRRLRARGVRGRRGGRPARRHHRRGGCGRPRRDGARAVGRQPVLRRGADGDRTGGPRPDP